MPAIRTGTIDGSERVCKSFRISIKRSPLFDLSDVTSDGDQEVDRPAPVPRPRQSYTNGKPTNLVLRAPDPGAQAITKHITVKGMELRPTVVFDTFWRFAAERKAIDDRRRAGEPQPWTSDPILQKYPFCNTYRVLDKLCQYLIREVIEKGSQDLNELVFRIVLFNLFTKIETWELLDSELGPLTWARYNRQDYQRVLTRAKRGGAKLYTGAFQKPAPHFGFSEAHMNHLCLLEVLMENDLAGRFLGANYMDEVYEYLVSFPSMGEFSTFQLMLNLSYSEVLNFSDMDFVVPGPGASSGLSKMFGGSIKTAKQMVPGFEVDVIRWLAEHQNEQFERLGIEFSRLGPDCLPMCLADIEHLLCEVDKYSRLAHPWLKGKRTEIRGVFRPSSGNHPPVPHLPKAWANSARRKLRIRPGGPPVVEKRYTVSRVGKHRQGARGVEYKVYWHGYSDAEATWEPEESLLADAPVAVKEYLDTLR